jgi:hypothetical protein
MNKLVIIAISGKTTHPFAAGGSDDQTEAYRPCGTFTARQNTPFAHQAAGDQVELFISGRTK